MLAVSTKNQRSRMISESGVSIRATLAGLGAGVITVLRGTAFAILLNAPKFKSKNLFLAWSYWSKFRAYLVDELELTEITEKQETENYR